MLLNVQQKLKGVYMNENKKFYWIKLRLDFFDLGAIDYIMSKPNGCEYIVLYQMLCLMSANNDGALGHQINEVLYPFDIDKISRDTKYFSVDTILVGLELFKTLGLIYYSENDNLLHIGNYESLIGSETAHAITKRNYRMKKKLSIEEKKNLEECIRLSKINIYGDLKK